MEETDVEMEGNVRILQNDLKFGGLLSVKSIVLFVFMSILTLVSVEFSELKTYRHTLLKKNAEKIQHRFTHPRLSFLRSSSTPPNPVDLGRVDPASVK